MKNTILQHQHIHTSTYINMSKHMNVKLKKERNKFCKRGKLFVEDLSGLLPNPRINKALCVTAQRHFCSH